MKTRLTQESIELELSISIKAESYAYEEIKEKLKRIKIYKYFIILTI